MNKRAKIMILMMCLFMCFGATTAFGATLEMDSVQANAGDTVDVSLSIHDNPGIVSVMLHVDYDKNYLTLQNVKDAERLGATMHSDNMESSPYILCWVNDTVRQNFMTEGNLVTLTFRVAADVPKGTTLPIRVSYDNDNYDIFDVDLHTVDFDVKNGGIQVTGTNTGNTGNTTDSGISGGSVEINPQNPAVSSTPEKQYNLTIVMQIDNRALKINDITSYNDVAPLILNNRTMVPIRAITESLGGSADWNEATRTVTLTIDDKVLSMTIDIPMEGFDTPPTILNGRTYVPVRYVAEAVGADVTWVNDTKEIVIRK